jgi:hypothetical protein
VCLVGAHDTSIRPTNTGGLVKHSIGLFPPHREPIRRP